MILRRPSRAFRRVRSRVVGQPGASMVLFRAWLQAHGLPEPEFEVEGLVEGRKFRVDVCWRASMTVLEMDGGIWKVGGHSTGRGILRDMEKANLLQVAGWIVLRVTPQQLCTTETLQLLQQVLR